MQESERVGADSAGQRLPAAVHCEARVKVDVQMILKGSAEVCLVHQGVEYRLRVTKQGKLLLTK